MTKTGRPTKITAEVRKKIEEGAALDATVEEICFYAGISRDTYYKLMKKEPVFSDRIEALRQRPILRARRAVVQSLDDPDFAFKYLERKRKGEFALRREYAGPDGGPLEATVVYLPGRKA